VANHLSRFALVLALTVCACACASAWAAAEPATQVRFNRDIRPILAENCFHCHGPDPGSRKAKLRFDREEGFFAKHGDDEATVVRGDPAQSPMYQRIIATDPDDIMPPPKEHKTLKPEEKALIKRWIAEGAPWEPHWSFIKPERPELPAVKDTAWVRNPIDRFVLARLEAVGLQPAPEADRRALARRLALDLTGLPPEPEQVEAFVADQSKDAYEKLVDALMSSPRYGEHRARYWLDAARYADTHGMHFDNYREIWPYRDWVINAFNQDQPFDQFTIEQIAGDLLPNPTREQRIATGFHRCNITTNEGGTIEAENLAGYARDRVETTSWVWLGLTANCAVCHDHKFDPIPTRDFYAMSAYFRNTTQGGLDGNVKDSAPNMLLVSDDDQRRIKALAADIETAKRAAEERKKSLRTTFDAWLESATLAEWNASLDRIGSPSVHVPLDQARADGAIAGTLAGKEITFTTAEPVAWEDGGKRGKVACFTEKTAASYEGGAGDFEHDKPYSYGCWVKLAKDSSGGAIFSRMDDGDGYRGWDLWVQGNEFAAHLIHHWSDDALKVRTKDNRVKRGEWQHVFVTYDGSGKASGLKLYVDGKAAKTETEADTLKSSTHTGAPFKLGRRKNGDILKGNCVQDIRLYDRLLPPEAVARLAFSQRAAALIAQPPKDRGKKEKDELFEVTIGGDAELKAVEERLAKAEAEQKSIRERNPVTLVQEEKKDSAPTAFILFRGQYDQPKDKVEAAVFSALHPMPEGAPKNRLGLAQWLVSKDNPLMPRVTVNRFWQELFGTGIVKTSEDFGIMGEPPSHPELLDWLAVEFRDGGWDVKKLIRTIVTSAAYRQSALATPEKIEKDPYDRLISRGPRFRMDAEMVRDCALSCAGVLSPKIGGPSVKPYQPGGVWEAVGMRESNTKNYQQDHGEALYRRSLYSFWKRMAPPAAMEILNAPARETACVRRERTNTPLQALVTLNDPQFIEAARLLAEHALKQGAADGVRLDWIARRVLARPLASAELEVVQRSLDTLRGEYRQKPDDAKALLAVGETRSDPAIDPIELAATTMLCNQMLNLDEALCK
jgi:hypothetical protein